MGIYHNIYTCISFLSGMRRRINDGRLAHIVGGHRRRRVLWKGTEKGRGAAGMTARGASILKEGGHLLSRALGAVPSALAGLTSLFGMGRGGAPPL